MQSHTIESLPRGFVYGGMVAGIKKSGKLDLSLIAATGPAAAAGVYTRNLVHATSIDWCRQRTPSQEIRGVVVNSGNANACTGREGEENNQRLAALAAEKLGCHPNQILVLSTGVIGQQLPMPVLEAAFPRFPELAGTPEAFHTAADAIMTTDQGRKVASASFTHQGQTYAVAAMAKGAGMIGPNMATMLAIVTTDYPLSPNEAYTAVRFAADASFNQISVDGHTSTNDAMLLLSSAVRDEASPTDQDALWAFQQALEDCCIRCAKLIPADGEGATHLLNLHVHGTLGDSEANQVARCIANSSLVKCAIHGNDPNWGRIVSAAGYAGVDFNPNEVELRLNGHLIFANGRPEAFDAATVSRSMQAEFEVAIDLKLGPNGGSARHYASDLTVDYVRFNSEYTT